MNNKNNLVHYGSDISGFKRLTVEEEKKLSKKIKRGDIDARNELVTANLKLVLSIAHKYTDSGIDLDDLVAEGNKWLITAAEKFDANKDVNFSTYAYFWVRHSMILMVKERGEWKDMTIELTSEDNLDIENFLFSEMTTGEGQMHSYYETKEQENEKYVNENLFNEVIMHLDKLNERESEIIKHYYGICNKEELNITEISKKYNITSTWVSNIIDSGIKKVRCAILENS